MRYIYSSFLAIGFSLWLALVPAMAQETPSSEPDPDEENPGPFYHRDEPMKFQLAARGGSHFTYYWISAQGMITKDTPKAFINFLRHDRDYLEALKDIVYTTKLMRDPKYLKAIENQIAYPETTELLPIHIHSCGGDEKAAMELGLIAKTYHLSFIIGQTFPDPEGSPQSFHYNGECIGACILTALGRPLPAEIVASSKAHFSLDSLTMFETPFPVIESYARKVGIDWEFLKTLLPKQSGEVRRLTIREAERLGLNHAASYIGDTLPPSENQRCRDSERLRKR